MDLGLSTNSMKIRYITPFSLEHNGSAPNIGGEYNQVISELPDDCYVVLRDCDTLFLSSDIGHKIKKIIEDNPQYHVITCRTNRLGIGEPYVVGSKFSETDVSQHVYFADFLWNKRNTACMEVKVAPGMLMIFHKSVWQKHKFEENSIFFDKIFSRKLIQSGGKIGLAIGLYIFHLYRWGQGNPKTYKQHLITKPGN